MLCAGFDTEIWQLIDELSALIRNDEAIHKEKLYASIKRSVKC